jgi:hypothetical protein
MEWVYYAVVDKAPKSYNGVRTVLHHADFITQALAAANLGRSWTRGCSCSRTLAAIAMASSGMPGDLLIGTKLHR